MLLTLHPLSQTVTPSRTRSPSCVTYFMDGPHGIFSGRPEFEKWFTFVQKLSKTQNH